MTVNRIAGIKLFWEIEQVPHPKHPSRNDQIPSIGAEGNAVSDISTVERINVYVPRLQCVQVVNTD
jgi:hypothetical protein